MFFQELFFVKMHFFDSKWVIELVNQVVLIIS
jgi:hypothetical protein